MTFFSVLGWLSSIHPSLANEGPMARSWASRLVGSILGAVKQSHEEGKGGGGGWQRVLSARARARPRTPY